MNFIRDKRAIIKLYMNSLRVKRVMIEFRINCMRVKRVVIEFYMDLIDMSELSSGFTYGATKTWVIRATFG